MKSSFELALERSGGALKNVSEDKKKQIAEIDNLCKSKLAGLEITYKSKFAKTGGNPEAFQQLENDLAVERASIISKAEKDKETIRKS
ncbi:MAG: hypothetical protein ACYC4Q_00305 [Victivallaceae bacterium]